MTESLILVTPVATAVYPKLFVPDRKFNPDGTYSVGLLFNPEDTPWAEFVEQVSAFDEAGYQQALKDNKKKVLKRNPVFLDDVDRDTEEPTGKMRFTAKMDAKVTTKDGRSWEQRPVVLDAKKNIITEDPSAGSGSRVRAKLEIRPYYVPAVGYGLSFRLKAIQIVELVVWKGDPTSGFDVDEAGYTATEAPSRGEAAGEF